MSASKYALHRKQKKSNYESGNERGCVSTKMRKAELQTGSSGQGSSIVSWLPALQKSDAPFRQHMISEIGRIHGNRYVQRLMVSLRHSNQKQTGSMHQHANEISRSKNPYSVAQSAAPRFSMKDGVKVESTKPLAGNPAALAGSLLIQQQSEPVSNLPTLSYGAQGDKVFFLQQRLNANGASIAVDGIFGPETYQAVRQFQASSAPPADGIVGPITWTALTSSSEDRPQDKENDEIASKDFDSIGQDLFAVQNALQQQDPFADLVFGSILQQTANKFLQASNSSPNSRSTLVSGGVFNVDSPALTIDTLKQQLDLLLKSIALAVNIQGFGTENSEELLLYKKVLVLHLISEHVRQEGLNPLPQEEVNLFLNRATLMRDFYNSFLNNENASSSPQIEKQTPIAGPHASERQRLVGMALSDVGKVRAHENPRFGWEHLKQIYDVAFNGNHPYQDQHFQNYSTTKQCDHGDQLCVETNKQQHSLPLVDRDILGSWCGIGAMYWLKIAGQTDLEWKPGVSGLANKLKHRPFTELPKVGDVVIDSELDHHGIITWIDPNAAVPSNPTEWGAIAIKTVESNVQQGQIVHAPSGHGTLGYFDRGAFNPFERR